MKKTIVGMAAIALLLMLLPLTSPAMTQDEPGSPSAGQPSRGQPGGGQPGGGQLGAVPLTGAPVEVSAVGSGIAERFWLRFLADNSATLWLFVDGSWRRMDNPSPAVQDSVQEAFCGCDNPAEVLVSYDDSTISWVVVRSK